MSVRIRGDRRPGRIVVDYDDASGRRRWKTFPKTQDGSRRANIFAGDIERKLARGEALPDERATFGEVAKEWLAYIRATVSSQTAANYESALRLHLLPEFGKRQIVRVTRAVFKGYVAELLTAGKLKRRTVAVKVVGVARSLFGWAQEPEQGYVTSNPAARLGRVMRLSAERSVVRAMTADQLSAFEGAVKRVLNEDDALSLLLLFRCGLRIGEMQGLRWGDFHDEQRPTLAIERQALKGGGIGPPKTKSGYRTVDVSGDLAEALRSAWVRRHEDRLKHGVAMTPWIACPEFLESPTRKQAENARARLRRAMKRALTEAKLPNFRVHDLRHTFCALLLSQGESVQYVQQQAGHGSIKETVDTYGSWIRAEAPGAMDRMAERTKPRGPADVAEFVSEKKLGHE